MQQTAKARPKKRADKPSAKRASKVSAKPRGTKPRAEASGKTPPRKRTSRKPGRPRKAEPSARRAAILEAALHVFAQRGFEAARLDDVAKLAGVAKGTLYLYFKDKEALFEEVVRSVVSPVLDRLNELAKHTDLPFDQVVDALYGIFVTEVLGTEKRLLIRLILTEGPRFPRISEFYYRNVIARVLPIIGKLAERAHAQGAVSTDALVRYPQLFAAPLLMTVIWDALFARVKPLDAEGLLHAYREIIAPAKPRRKR